MQDVGVLVLVLHHDQVVQCGGEDQAKAVDDVQSFEADCVFDPWLPCHLGIQFEEHLDPDGGDHEEGGGDDLRGYANIGQVLVPLAQRGVGQVGFILGQVRL